MAKKRKNGSGVQKNSSPEAKRTEQKSDFTIRNIEESETEQEFENCKAALLKNLNDEIASLEAKKKAVEETSTKIKGEIEEQEEIISNLTKQKGELQTSFDAIKEEYDIAVLTIKNTETDAEAIISSAKSKGEEITTKAEETAATIRSQAEVDARLVCDNAEKERIEKLVMASEEARNVWKTQFDNLRKQIEDISARETELHTVQLDLQREKQDLDFKKESFDELNEHVRRLQIKYSAANPIKISELELELDVEHDRYRTLLESYENLKKRSIESQVLLHTIKTEIEDSADGKKTVQLNEIVSAMHDFKEKYEKISEIYSKYPDNTSIAILEEKAKKVEEFERANDALEQERNRYREEAIAARNANKELEVVKQEVEATNALNEHLLKELESHKTALESRTGDTCPSLSKVDSETEDSDFVSDIIQRSQRTPITSLKEIVTHIKNYAGSRGKAERLFYKDNDIRAFLAGMAVSRLIILQGMSGTGKSSLPRIFSEAISGFHKLIPVESSWRDRNELLGYYNDFNKKFNAKKFTIDLYTSSKKRCQEVPTFIVLDEMNLARIEYYFSDFLAILEEPDHDRWLIELVSSDMRTLPLELQEDVKQKMKIDDPTVFSIWEKVEQNRQGDLKSETSDEEKETLALYLEKLGRMTGAKDLIAGRKIKVTDNVWFVGTANQDESTFEISDKVYDRAQVISLHSKGVSEGNYKHVDKRFIPVTDLLRMFETEINGYEKRKAVEERLEVLDNILIEKFDVSFGNRIVKQTIDFTAIFTAAGGTLEDAIDYQISTKILRKVISSDDSEAFLHLLDKTKDYPETQRLIQKRIKDIQ